MIIVLFLTALALAPGLQCATQTRDLPSISTFPINIGGEQIQIQTLPGVYVPAPQEETVVPELRPEFIPELRPEPLPEVEAVIPELITINPCDTCFEYMTSLIDQLTETVVVPEIEPHPMPEVGVLPVPSPGGSVEVGPRPLGSLGL